MRTVEKIVALHQHAAAVPQRRARKQRVATALLSPIDYQYCAFSLASIIVSDGVMHGDVLSCFDDFMAGDTYKIIDETGRLAANDRSAMAPVPANTVAPDDAEIVALGERSDVLRMTLLDDSGSGFVWYAVAPEEAALRDPYVLIPRTLPSDRKLTLIDARPL